MELKVLSYPWEGTRSCELLFLQTGLLFGENLASTLHWSPSSIPSCRSANKLKCLKHSFDRQFVHRDTGSEPHTMSLNTHWSTLPLLKANPPPPPPSPLSSPPHLWPPPAGMKKHPPRKRINHGFGVLLYPWVLIVKHLPDLFASRGGANKSINEKSALSEKDGLFS